MVPGGRTNNREWSFRPATERTENDPSKQQPRMILRTNNRENREWSFDDLHRCSRNQQIGASRQTETPTMDRDDDIAKVSRTLIDVDDEHRQRDPMLDPKMNWKPVKTSRAEVTWSRARTPIWRAKWQRSEDGWKTNENRVVILPSIFWVMWRQSCLSRIIR